MTNVQANLKNIVDVILNDSPKIFITMLPQTMQLFSSVTMWLLSRTKKQQTDVRDTTAIRSHDNTVCY